MVLNVSEIVMFSPPKRNIRILKSLPWLVAASATVIGFISGAYYLNLKLCVSFADDQVSTFEQMKALSYSTSDPHSITSNLAYIINYYPSGSKQTKGTRLDKVVEHSRSDSIADIICRLKALTGQAWEDPKKWIAEYPPPN